MLKYILIVSLIIHGIFLLIAAPWLKTRMEFDKAEEVQRTEDVRKRELARQEYERLKREKVKLDPEVAKKLRKEAEERKRQTVKEDVEKLRRLRDQILERQKEELQKIQNRQHEDLLAVKHLELKRITDKLTNKVENAYKKASFHALLIGGTGDGWFAINGMIDNLKISKEIYTPEAPNINVVHEWNFDGNLKDLRGDSNGSLKRDAKLVESPDSGGKALSARGRDEHANFGNIDLGNQFSIAFQANLKPNRNVQVLAANRKTVGTQVGFRFLAQKSKGGNNAAKLVLSTTGPEGGTEVKTESLDDSFTYDEWHWVVLTMDKDKEEVHIYVDGKDVTKANGKVAKDTFTGEHSITQDIVEKVNDFQQMMNEEVPDEESKDELIAELNELEEALNELIEDNPELVHEVNDLRSAVNTTNQLEEALNELEELSDLEAMNDTSDSVADKMEMEQSGEEQTVSDYYAEAQQLEEQIAEAYADIDAAVQAAQDNDSYSDAREEYQALVPERPDLFAENESDMGEEGEEGEEGDMAQQQQEGDTIGDVAEYRQKLDQASNEINDMTARAGRFMESAANKTVGNYNEEGGQANDTQAGRVMAASSDRGYGAIVDMTQFSTGFSASGTGSMSEQMREDMSGEGSSMVASKNRVTRKRADEEEILKKALPGRRFTEDSIRQGWLYIDTWYVIGPWENNSRVDFDNKHQPEYEINFDAEYYDGKFANREGHPDQVLSWEFYQSDQMRCQPPRVYGASTYYAYTEIWFEEPREMLIAVASDDAASVWLNDNLIWQDHGQSAWMMGEGYRRVRFKRGYNTILTRIENGPINCIWSILLCPPDDDDSA